MTAFSPTALEHSPRTYGNRTFVLLPDGTALPFLPQEKKFLTVLDQTHNLEEACKAIDKPLTWSESFFARPKVHEWISYIAAQTAAKNGMTVEWWFGKMLAVVNGKEVWWETECACCHIKQKTYVEPSESIIPCIACYQPVVLKREEKTMKMDRQQMVALQEIGSRVCPKIERVSHEFNSDQYIFSPKSDD